VSYTTFTVTVNNPGSGNKYYINGAQQATVDLAYGATYRFDQSDSSNAGHPLRFSETSDGTHGGGTEYTTGVTAYGTPGQAGAYTEFFVSEVGPPSVLYYYCNVHSGMGGTANLASNSWGALSWGKDGWANQGNIILDTVSGQSLTLVEGFANGAVVANADISVSGIQITSSQGSGVGGTSVITSPSGIQMTLSQGDEVTGIGAGVTGQSLSTSIGTATVDETTLTGEGWGRAEWGEFAWGDNFSVQVTGIQLTSSIGNETAITDVTVGVSGSQLTSTFGSFSIISDVGITVFAAEDQLDFTIGSLSFDADANVTVTSAGQLTSTTGNAVGGVKTPVDVTGIQASMTLGSITLIQTTTESVSGNQATISLGNPAEIPGQHMGVSGLQLQTSVGSVTATGQAGIDVTGIQMTASVGSTNVTPWSEIDTGVNNVWSEVDLAA